MKVQRAPLTAGVGEASAGGPWADGTNASDGGGPESGRVGPKCYGRLAEPTLESPG